MDLQTLKKALMESWGEDTASKNVIWKEYNPSLGQCSISALVVQDYLHGEIVFSDVKLPNGSVVSHYFNCINGVEVDVTREQFRGKVTVPGGKNTKNGIDIRQFLLQDEVIQKRYHTLKERVEKNLKDV